MMMSINVMNSYTQHQIKSNEIEAIVCIAQSVYRAIGKMNCQIILDVMWKFGYFVWLIIINHKSEQKKSTHTHM